MLVFRTRSIDDFVNLNGAELTQLPQFEVV
jgi:hypothetical protein